MNRYWVNVIANNGCKGTDTLTVIYSGRFESSITNAFSPNGDKINDEFKPYAHTGCFRKYSIAILNRSGQKVFESIDPAKAWDGNLNNRALPVGVYYYIIKLETTTGNIVEKSGSLSLFR